MAQHAESTGGDGSTQSPLHPAGIADSLSSREWDQLVDIVVRRMERRLTDELARRGRRSTPRVF
jgi:hypothetical protein